MFRSVSLLSLTLAAVPAFAEPATHTVVADGERMEYASRLAPGEVVAIEGRSVDSHESFHLIVLPTGRVRGAFGPVPVSFMISRTHRARLVEQLRAQRSSGVAMAVSTITPASN
ncbi:MAG: hypothetical protein ABIQ32_05560 [Sphingomicrobium sp.]